MVFGPVVYAAVQYQALTRMGERPESVASKVAETIRAGGVVPHKMAQIAASRPDVITDKHLLRELRCLQSTEIRPDVHEASIATVTLDRTTGLATKRIKDAGVLRDGETLKAWLAVLRVFQRVPNVAVCVDMLETLSNELDFKSEKRKNELLRSSLSRSDVVIVPETLLSDKDSVVMRIQDAVLAKDLEEPVPLAVVLGFFRDMTMAAVRTGVVHLDLHSGNVGYDSTSGRIVVYDMGSVRSVDTEVTRRAFLAAFHATELLFFEDWDGLARHLVERKVVIDVKDTRNLRRLTDVSVRYAQGHATAVDIGECLRDIKGDVSLHASIFQLIQSVSILEGCCKVLNPDFTISESLMTGASLGDLMEVLEA